MDNIAPLPPDRDMLAKFSAAMFKHAGADGYVSLRAFYEDDSKKPFRITPISMKGGLPFLVEAVEDDANRAANHPRKIVFCPPVAIFNNKDRAREEDILEGLALTVECDQRAREARAALEEIIGPATLVVRSGGEWTDPETGQLYDKLHLHWRLRVPARGADLATLKTARDLATRLAGGDPSNKPVCHPIRWPGSWHRKGEPRLCEIEIETEHEIDLAIALAELEKAATPAQAEAAQANANRNGAVVVGGPGSDWAELISGIATGTDYHDATTRLAAKVLAAGMADGAAVNMLRAMFESTNAPRDARWQARYDDIPRAVTTARSKYGATSALARANSAAFTFEYAKDFDSAVAPRWIVKNHIAHGEISSWIGPPGGGKSAALGDLAIHIAAGRPSWRSNLIKEKCGVLYFALERHDLVKRRFKVQAGKMGLCLEDLPFAVVKEVIDLMNPACVEQIIATIKSVEAGWTDCKVGMIIIDTDAKAIAAGGGDENTAKDTNIAHANLRRIQVLRDVHIALAGHTGKDESRGQRGSNAPRGDVDKENTFRDGEVIRTKNNDGPEGRLFGYRMEVVVIGVDEDGENVSIAIMADDDPGSRKASRRAKLNKTQRRAMELLDRALIERGDPAPLSGEIPHGVGTVVTKDVWRGYCIDGNLSAGSVDSSEKAFRRAMTDLVGLHLIGTWKEWVWIAYD